MTRDGMLERHHTLRDELPHGYSSYIMTREEYEADMEAWHAAIEERIDFALEDQKARDYADQQANSWAALGGY